ncbi:MAG: ATP-dependent Clp protease proteolytic subunit [bacterium]|nr:ATP-dependent Clp protease proteolytic subunit [bacterium]
MPELIRQGDVFNQAYPAYQRTREMSIEEMLLENRIIFLSGPILERTASVAIMRLLYLESIKKDQEINLYINSPGGLVDQTLAIYDTIKFLNCEVATYCIGQAASGAAIVLMAGVKGKRYILEHAKVMLHQPYGGISGQAEDIRIQAEEVIRDKRLLNEIVAVCTGQEYDRVCEYTERDRYLNADEALEFGIVDEVLKEEDKAKKPSDSASKGK